MSLDATSQATLNVLLPVLNAANSLIAEANGYVNSLQGTGSPTAIAALQGLVDGLQAPLAILNTAVGALKDAAAQA
jgi:hypothetical protein